jgi:AhpD family alkylhydroperoxidase
MNPRLDYAAISPEGVDALRALDRNLRRSELSRSLLELVKIRVSQLNGCAYCIDMHTKVARAQGETEQRIYALSAWRETPFFDERERAALTWAETLTHVAAGVSDHVYDSVRRHFDEAQLVELTYAIVAINGWNRIAVAFRKVPGTYEAAPALRAGNSTGS